MTAEQGPKEPERPVEEPGAGPGSFRMPFPPPFPPPFVAEGGEEPQDVVFFMRPAPPPPGPVGREAEDIMLRRVPAETAKRFRVAAGGRGMTHAQYLSALVSLHEALRGLADAGDERIAAQLDRLGLASVTV